MRLPHVMERHADVDAELIVSYVAGGNREGDAGPEPYALGLRARRDCQTGDGKGEHSALHSNSLSRCKRAVEAALRADVRSYYQASQPVGWLRLAPCMIPASVSQEDQNPSTGTRRP
jgi:hypothetical protein